MEFKYQDVVVSSPWLRVPEAKKTQGILSKKYMTQQEVADYFGVSVGTVINWRKAGELDFFRPPGSTRVMYPRESVLEFERRCIHRVEPPRRHRVIDEMRKRPGMSSKPRKEWRI
ncbi:MAG TPA: DNA-binding protein [Deltaproteobacteria bacterium]|nr:DNA-binding protein [Deltaproteobacteria bacterium]